MVYTHITSTVVSCDAVLLYIYAWHTYIQYVYIELYNNIIYTHVFFIHTGIYNLTATVYTVTAFYIYTNLQHPDDIMHLAIIVAMTLEACPTTANPWPPITSPHSLGLT